MNLFRKKEKEKSEYKDVELLSTKNIIYRRIVYIIFITIFLVITPLILLYTQGYRYNFNRQRIQKTGILIASSIPKKADIYLNGKLIVGKQTPARIEKLLPADYEIKISKDGYHDWTKKLHISENSTTFAEDIILWKNNLPIELRQYEIIDWSVSSNKENVVIVTKERKIILFKPDDKLFYDIYQGGIYDNIDIINWSNTNKKITIKSGENYLIINTERLLLPPIKINDKKYKKLKWDLKNDNIVYGLTDAGIWKIDLFSLEKKLIFNGTISDFIIDNETIYTLSKNIIYKQKTYESKNPEIIDGIKCDNCQFVNYDLSKLILLDKENKKLYIIDPEGKIKTIEKEATNISWLKDNTILFYNDWEIWIFETNKKEPEIITRTGAGISEAIWHPEGRHIIYISENKIKIIELDNRELRNVIELFSSGQIKNLTINVKGDNIYFRNLIADKEYFMELTIK